MQLHPFEEYLIQRFGIKIPENCKISGEKRLRLFPKGLEFELKINKKELKYFNIGLNAGKFADTFKPSTDFLQIFGFMCTRNIIFLDQKQENEFLKGKELLLSEKETAFSTNGFVAIFSKNICIGCGLLKGNILESNIPKHRRINF